MFSFKSSGSKPKRFKFFSSCLCLLNSLHCKPDEKYSLFPAVSILLDGNRAGHFCIIAVLIRETQESRPKVINLTSDMHQKAEPKGSVKFIYCPAGGTSALQMGLMFRVPLHCRCVTEQMVLFCT